MTDDEEVLAYLEHFGIKGQRWGVRRERETSGKGQSDVQKDLAKNPPKPLTKQEKANVARASKKFEAQRQMGEDEPEPSGWRPTKKQKIAIGVGAAAAAAIVGGLVINKQYQDYGSKPFSVDKYKKFVNDDDPPDWISGYSGKKMSVDDYKGLTQTSIGRVWSKKYITKKSFDQEETTLPAGHRFFRVTHNKDEQRFDPATYCLAKESDVPRYQLGWKAGDTNLVDFRATSDVRVPNLHTRLEATREVLRDQGRRHVTPDDVIQTYSNESGGAWTHGSIGPAIMVKLKEKGFHAIVDDMDAGVYGEMPLVLIDPSRVGNKNTTLYQDLDLDAMAASLTEIPNRR